MSSIPLCFPPAWALSHRDDGAALAQGQTRPCTGSGLCHYPASEPGLPGVGIARRLPGDNLPHSLHAPCCAPDSRPAPVFWLLRGFQGFPGNAQGQVPLPGLSPLATDSAGLTLCLALGAGLDLGFVMLLKQKGLSLW